LLFEHGRVGRLTSRRGHPTRHCLDHGTVRPVEEGGEEGHRLLRQTSRRLDQQWFEEWASPMSHHTRDLARWVAYIPVFTAVKAVKQSAGLWPGPRLLKMPAALISSGF